MRLALLFLFALFSAGLMMQPGPYGADWAPLWVAGNLALTEPNLVYDFDLVTRLQAEPFRQVTDRPFIYPPSALILFAPLSTIPFWVSFGLFSAASLAWFLWVSRKMGADTLLVAVGPPVVLAAIAGQPSLLVAGLVIWACASPPARAGVLFGVAAMLKPTLLVLLPVALLAARQWTTIGWATLTASCLALTSVALFGWECWQLWLDALPQFQQLIADSPHFLRTAVTPYALSVRLGHPSVGLLVAMLLIAIPCVWFTFSSAASSLERSAILMGGALLVSPYAMFYDLAVLAPLVLARREPVDRVVAAIWGVCLFASASVLGLVAVFARAMARLMTGSAAARSATEEPLPKSAAM